MSQGNEVRGVREADAGVAGGDRGCFVMDVNRCTGCGACVLACSIQNPGTAESGFRGVYGFNERRHPGLPAFALSLACNHCEAPACLENCPAGAYRRDKLTGAVVHDASKCIGCKYCTWACPYDAPRYREEPGVTGKCDFCVERRRGGEVPACVRACPVEALRLASREEADGDPDLMAAGSGPYGFTGSALGPSIRFVRPRGGDGKGARIPEMTAPPAPERAAAFMSCVARPVRKITLKSEWALLAFTVTASLLTAFFLALTGSPERLNPFLFLGAGALAMGLSAAHLGKKTRAPRAITNIRTSWLSREIVFFSLFLGLAGLYMLFFPHWRLLGVLAGGAALAALVSIDMLYHVALKAAPLEYHSGQTLFTGVYLAGLLGRFPVLFFTAGAVKLLLYLWRKRYFARTGAPAWGFPSAARIALGFVLPPLTFIIPSWDVTPVLGIVFGLAALADLADRMEFYLELDVLTPVMQINRDMEALLASRNH